MRVFEVEDGYKKIDHEDGRVERLYKKQGNFDYPALVIDGVIERYHLDILKNILDPLESTFDGSYFYFYIKIDGVYVNIGKLSSKKLYMFLTNKIFSTFDKKIYMDKENIYVGDMLYAFCEL